MLKFLLPCLLLIITLPDLHAQTNTQERSWYADISASLLYGSTQGSGQILATGGRVFSKGWSAGAGVALDEYVFRSVPVFARAEKEFGPSRHRFFAFAGAGINLANPTDEQISSMMNGWMLGQPQFGNGAYSDIGFGYRLFNRKGRGIHFSLGHSFKTMSETHTEQVWTGGGVMQETTTKYDYRFSRLLLRVGFRF